MPCVSLWPMLKPDGWGWSNAARQVCAALQSRCTAPHACMLFPLVLSAQVHPHHQQRPHLLQDPCTQRRARSIRGLHRHHGGPGQHALRVPAHPRHHPGATQGGPTRQDVEQAQGVHRPAQLCVRQLPMTWPKAGIRCLPACRGTAQLCCGEGPRAGLGHQAVLRHCQEIETADGQHRVMCAWG